MDIVVQGEGKKLYKPDEVVLSLEFHLNDETYEKVLEKGTKAVEVFIEKIMTPLTMTKEELKTDRFKIYKNIRYDYDKKENIFLGYDYSHSTTLKLNYDMSVVAKIMDEISKLENPPKYVISFTIKDKEAAKKEVMSEAYTKAKEKAEVIAMSAGKTLKDCIRVDFRPFSNTLCSNTYLRDSEFGSARMLSLSTEKRSVSSTIEEIFTPEDVEVNETLYCLWVTQ